MLQHCEEKNKRKVKKNQDHGSSRHREHGQTDDYKINWKSRKYFPHLSLSLSRSISLSFSLSLSLLSHLSFFLSLSISLSLSSHLCMSISLYLSLSLNLFLPFYVYPCVCASVSSLALLPLFIFPSSLPFFLPSFLPSFLPYHRSVQFLTSWIRHFMKSIASADIPKGTEYCPLIIHCSVSFTPSLSNGGAPTNDKK